jgi:putative ABC transport system substrate-binding protein
MARFSRRQFVTATAALLLLQATSHAQQQGRSFRVGVIGNISPDTDPDAARLYSIFVEALRDRGYIEGTNLVIERRFVEGRFERYSVYAAEFTRLKVDVIVVGSGPGVRAAMESTARIPIVMNGASDPVAAGLVTSLSHPGGNVTGIADLQIDLIPKRLALLKQAAPKISRVLFLHSRFSGFSRPASAAVEKEQESAAERLGVTLLRLEMREPRDFESAAASILRQKPDALLLSPNPTNYVVRRELAAFALKQRLPTIGGSRVMATAGALMSYGADLGDHYRKVAEFVDKILKGANPADLPVEQPTKFEFVINRNTARSLGLSIPSALLQQADDTIS